MEHFRLNDIAIYAKECGIIASSVCPNGQFIETKGSFFEIKWPHHGCSIFWPVADCMNQESSSYQGDFLYLSFNNAILIMKSNCAKCDGFISILHCIVKYCICKASIISSIGFDSYSSVIFEPLKICFS